MATCAEDIDLAEYGIGHNKCIDDDLMILFGYYIDNRETSVWKIANLYRDFWVFLQFEIFNLYVYGRNFKEYLTENI